jgi:hypothetical protein
MVVALFLIVGLIATEHIGWLVALGLWTLLGLLLDD